MDFINHFNNSQHSSILSVFEQQQPPWMFTPTPRDLRPPLVPHQHLLVPALLIHFTIVFSAHAPFLRKLAAPAILAAIIYPMNAVASRHWAIAFLSGAVLFYQTLMAVNYLLVVDVYNDPRFRLENDDREPSQLGFWERNKWVSKLCMTARGVGFRFRPRGVADPVDMSRGEFFVGVFARLVFCYVLMDHFSFIVNFDPFFTKQSCWKAFSPFVSLPSSVENFGAFDDRCYPSIVPGGIPAKLAWILVRNCCISSEVYGLLTSMYDFLSLIVVCILRIDEPKNWPRLFGSIGSVFHGKNAGMRNFWGRFWHQSFRLHFSLPSEAIIRLLGLNDEKPASAERNGATTNGHVAPEKQQPSDVKKAASRRKLRNNIMAITTYVNSGLLHFVGCVTLGVPGYGSFAFFSLQFLGTFLEDLFLPRNAAVRVMWMLFFIQITSPFFFIDLLNGEQGDGAGWNTPFSLWRLLASGGDVKQMWQWGDTGSWFEWDQSLGGWGIAV